MQVRSIDDLPSYVAFLRLHSEEAISLQQDLLASGTNFFRDQEAFRALQAELLNLLAEKNPGEQIRV
jgi:two-component system, chemotaxis family, CheB/CheR fusion protein